MSRKNWVLVGISILSLAMHIRDAAATATLSLAAKDFEKTCLSARESCTYKNVRFESTSKVFMEVHSYMMLRNRRDIDTYNKLIKAYLTPGLVRGMKSSVVQLYNYDTNTWLAVTGTNACKHCADPDSLAPSLPRLIRIDLVQKFAARQDEYITFGLEVYKGEPIKARIYISAPSLFHPNDRSPIYVDSRIKGRHATTSLTKGGIWLDFDGNDVPGSLPDYVAISPVKSWIALGTTYREREFELLKNANYLPSFTDGTPQQRLDRVMRQLQAYGIDYDGSMGGGYPSITPARVIAAKHGECKALATLADALLQRSGLAAHVVMLSVLGNPPASFNVPDPFWTPLHVILYIPSLDLYIDPTMIAAHSAHWKTSAAAYRGAIALDMTAGRFVVIH